MKNFKKFVYEIVALAVFFFGIAGFIYAATVLPVPQGGTQVGQNGFPINSIVVTGTSTQTGQLSATSSPTVGWIYATSTTATSTFSGGLLANQGLVVNNGGTTINNGLTVSGGGLSLPAGSVTNSFLQNSTISGISLGGTLGALTATDGTLTFSGSYTGATARTVGLNLGNANTWTASQFFNASSTITPTLNVGSYLIGSTTFATLGNLWTTGSSTVQGALNVSGGSVLQGGLTLNGGATLNGAINISNVAITGGSVTGITDLVVADGGTGVSTLASNGVLYGAGTSAISVTAAGAVNELLASAGGAPFFTGGATTTNLYITASSTIGGTLSIGGSTLAFGQGQIATTSIASVVITNPDNSDSPLLQFMPLGARILHYGCTASTTLSTATINVPVALYQTPTNVSTWTNLTTNGIDGTATITCATVPVIDDGSLSNSVMPSRSYLGLKVGAVTGATGTSTVTLWWQYYIPR